MHQYDDDSMLMGLKEGNEWAFEQIFERYRKRLYMEAWHRLKDAVEADDVVQEVFMWLWDKRNTIKINISLSQYLLQAVRYKCIDKIRVKVKNQKLKQHYSYIKETSEIDTSLENIELGYQLSHAIEQISPARRTAFTMMYIEKKEPAKIATELGINLQTVRDHVHHALKILRKKLKNR